MNKKWMVITLLLLSTFLPQDCISSQIQYNQSTHNNSQASTSDNVAFLLKIINSPATKSNQSIDPYASLDLDFDIDPYASLDIDIDPSGIAVSSSTLDQLPLPPSSRFSQKRKATDLDNSVVLPQTILPSITTATLSTNTQPSKKKEKSKICNYVVNLETGGTCGKRFEYRSELIEHIRTHTGEQPFACSICNKDFRQKSTLTVHTRIHTGKQPFACRICNQRFSRSSNLKVHTRSKRHLDAVATALALPQGSNNE